MTFHSILEPRGRAPPTSHTYEEVFNPFTTPAGGATLGGTKDPEQTPR